MKRFVWIALMIGLFCAFIPAANAADLKISGEFIAAGLYQDRTTVKKDTASDGSEYGFLFSAPAGQSGFCRDARFISDHTF